jgi:hypothetical protein
MKTGRWLRQPGKLLLPLGKRGYLRWLPDPLYLRIVYRGETGQTLRLGHPRTYTEKLQWLKLHDRNPAYRTLVDKYAVREWVAARIGSQYLVDLLGYYDSVEDIDLSRLPDQFVLKTTHGSTWNILCFDKSTMDWDAARRKLHDWMERSVYNLGREWPYKGLRPRIICEKLLTDQNGKVPDDYKFFCFGGQPRVVLVHKDRWGDHREVFYDAGWNRLEVKADSGNLSLAQNEKPERYDEMIRVAATLSAGLRHVRVDLYNMEGRIYFGEMTFFPGSGFVRIEPDESNELWGSWIRLD